MKPFSARLILAFCAVWLAFTHGSQSRVLADGILRDGIGAISTGRGGTNLAFADNGSVILDNPGSLVNVAGSGLFELGADMLVTDLSYQDVDNAKVSAANDPFPMGQISIIRKSADGIFAWGLGAFSQAGFSAVYDLNGPLPLSGPQHYKSVGALMRVLPSASVALTDRWSIGATLGVAVSHTELEGPYFTQYATPFRGTPTLLDLQATGAGLSWSLGTQYQLSCNTTLGLSFQAQTHIKADGSAVLTIPGLGSSRFDLDLDTKWPSVLGLGIRHQLTTNIFAAEVLWTNWSAAKDSYDMNLSNPTNPVFGAVIGPSLPEQFPLAWRDSVGVRLGYERLLAHSQVVRVGYAYHPNVIPAETLTPFIQATVQNSLSAGYGWQGECYGINLGYQYMFGPDQSVGVSRFVGGDFDGSTSSAAAHWFLASIIRRF